MGVDDLMMISTVLKKTRTNAERRAVPPRRIHPNPVPIPHPHSSKVFRCGIGCFKDLKIHKDQEGRQSY